MVQRLEGRQFSATNLPAGRVPVMFMADWCGYCARFLPLFRQLGQGIIVDISDEEDPLWEFYGIQVVPTVILFEDGEPAKRWSGVLGPRDADKIREATADD